MKQQKLEKEIEQLKKACESKDVIIRSACDIITDLVENLEDETGVAKDNLLDEVRYFKECCGYPLPK